MCSLHFIKSTETRVVKMFSTKTSRDVGMVQCISHLCPHGKTNWQKTSGTRRGTIPCNKPCRSTFSGFKTLWLRFHHPYIQFIFPCKHKYEIHCTIPTSLLVFVENSIYIYATYNKRRFEVKKWDYCSYTANRYSLQVQLPTFTQCSSQMFECNTLEGKLGNVVINKKRKSRDSLPRLYIGTCWFFFWA